MGDYALDLLSPMRHVATELDRVAPAALSVSELASTYRHPNTGDIARVKQHEGCTSEDEVNVWLVRRVLTEWRRVPERASMIVVDGDRRYRLADGVTFETLQTRRYMNQRLERDVNPHAQLRDPFDPMTGHFSENIRRGPDRDDLTELRESMQTFGWVPEMPALRDERGVILVGHRRLKVAAELGIDPEIKPITVGDGDEADARRFAITIASNLGQRPLTGENRKRIAEYLYGERDWTMARIAEALKVSQKTISQDLSYTSGITRPTSRGGRPRKLTPEQEEQVIDLHFEQGHTIQETAREVLGDAMPKGQTPSSVLKVIDQERGRREARVTPVPPVPDVPSVPGHGTEVADSHACPACGHVHRADEGYLSQ